MIYGLHVDYFYNGDHPESYEEGFEKWYEEVEDFVKRLEREEMRILVMGGA